jgi:hypothetical protein
MGPTVVVGPAGVFVVGGRSSDVRDVRDALDAVGLRALPATEVSGVPLDAVRAHADSDRRFGPSTLRRARAALGISDPAVEFPFVADVSSTPEASTPPVPAARVRT